MSLEKRLRVVKLNPQNSYFNVAIDEAILELVKEGKVPPTIVFTEWTPTISVGYSQDVGKDVDLNALKKHNATLVIVTHDESIANTANRIVTLKDGQILSHK